MKCEHAQEFFSEYIEKSLDKPTGVALEAHLTACGSCRRELDGLRQTWGALNAVPSLEPPADLAWRVMCQLQEEKLQRLEAEATRKAKNPFIGWLQALTPGAAFGYATLTALLIIAALFPFMPKAGVIFGPMGSNRPAVTVVDLHPQMTLVGPLQEAQTGRWIMRLVVTAPADLGQTSVTVTPLILRDREWVEREQDAVTQGIAAGQSQAVVLPATVDGQRVLVARVRGRVGKQAFHEDVLVPAMR